MLCRRSLALLILVGLTALVVNGQQVQNVSQAIIAQGYPCEVHTVETTDGFILTTIRIPHGIAANNSNSDRPVVFLQHGLLDSADTWVVNSPSESLAFILADAGFDVWLGNVRGNTYSSVNTKYSGVDLWTLVDFDNMIAIDLPTMVDLALNTSGAKSLAYVGHSQGTLMGFGGFSSLPDLAAKINIFIALAPVAYVGNVNSILLEFLADINLAEWFAFFGEEEFMPSDEIIKILAGTLCVDVPEACSSIIFLLCGYDPSDLNETRVHVYMDDAPAGTSVRNMMHWSQSVASGKFQKFDYGTVGNMANYGQATPPQYYLEQLTGCPVALFTGTLDILADPADVNILEKKLPANNQPVLNINEPTYDHLDFVWGMDAHIKVYPYVIQLAQKYAPNSK